MVEGEKMSDLLGTSMQEETDLMQDGGTEEEEGRDEDQTETSLCMRSS